MPQTVKGVVAMKQGEPVSIENIVIPDPGPGEAVVAIQACGVCHTDLHYREGGINDEFPFLLGHEASGIVESVGEGVTDVAVGDFVILNWRAVCGTCRSCLKGKPQICFSTFNAEQKMTLEDGTEAGERLDRSGTAVVADLEAAESQRRLRHPEIRIELSHAESSRSAEARIETDSRQDAADFDGSVGLQRPDADGWGKRHSGSRLHVS